MAKAKATTRYRPIQGFPAYRVGDDGSVWTRWRRHGHGRGTGTTVTLGDTWRRLKVTPQPNGRIRYTLRRGGVSHYRQVHHLVLEAFVGPCPKGMECRHFPDRDPANNRLENLQWGTKKQNQADRVTHGTNIRGELTNTSKLTADKVRAIRATYVRGVVGCRHLAARFGVSVQAIWLIIHRKNWKHV